MTNKKIKYKSFCFERKFGIEIELSNNLSKKRIKSIINEVSHRDVLVTRYANSYDNKIWHVKTDGSCGPKGDYGPNGVEIATFVCNSMSDLNHVLKIVKEIKRNGGLVNDFCGLHIHADASDLNLNSLGRIIIHWLTIEPILMFALPTKRWGNKFCQSLAPINFPKLVQYQYQHYGYSGVANAYQPIPNDLYARRKTLNLTNFYRALRLKTDVRKTLELRWPEGTLNINDIQGWVVFFLNFIESTKDKDFSYSNTIDKNKHISLTEFFEILNLGHKDEFFIFDKTIHKNKLWLLNRFIQNENIINSDNLLGFFQYIDLQNSIKQQAQTLLNMITKCNHNDYTLIT